MFQIKLLRSSWVLYKNISLMCKIDKMTLEIVRAKMFDFKKKIIKFKFYLKKEEADV